MTQAQVCGVFYGGPDQKPPCFACFGAEVEIAEWHAYDSMPGELDLDARNAAQLAMKLRRTAGLDFCGLQPSTFQQFTYTYYVPLSDLRSDWAWLPDRRIARSRDISVPCPGIRETKTERLADGDLLPTLSRQFSDAGWKLKKMIRFVHDLYHHSDCHLQIQLADKEKQRSFNRAEKEFSVCYGHEVAFETRVPIPGWPKVGRDFKRWYLYFIPFDQLVIVPRPGARVGRCDLESQAAVIDTRMPLLKEVLNAPGIASKYGDHARFMLRWGYAQVERVDQDPATQNFMAQVRSEKPIECLDSLLVASHELHRKHWIYRIPYCDLIPRGSAQK